MVLCAPPSVEWYIAQYSCILSGFIVVPVHASTSIPSLSHIFNKSKPACVIASRHLRSQIMRARKNATSRPPLVVLIDDCADATALRPDMEPEGEDNNQREREEEREKEKEKGKEKETEKEKEDKGKEKARDEEVEKEVEEDALKEVSFEQVELERKQVIDNSKGKNETKSGDSQGLSADDVTMLLPTSGTSGLPKLTIVTEGMMKAQGRPPDFGVDIVMLSFEPLRQSLDVLVKGGQIGMYSGSMDRLLVR